MRILLFGVSNVGKSTTGKLLADQLGIAFYDLDDEVRDRLGISLEEFVNTADLRWRDQKRGRIIKEILRSGAKDFVLAVTPISYTDNFRTRIISDEKDNVYSDDQYKNEHKDHYLKDIRADLEWYGKIYTELRVQNRIFINNEPPEKVVDRIISEYDLMDI